MAIDYGAFAVGFPAPRVGRTPQSEAPVGPEHLAERYQQFFIIALGELILVTGLAVSRSGFGPGRTAAFLTSIATTVLLWRIYLYRAGQLLPQAIAAAPEPVRLGLSASYAHLVMVAGVVVAAVGAELVIAHPLGHTRPAWVAVILGGPALFLAGRACFDYAVFAHVSWDRLIGLLTLAALTAPMLLVPPLPTTLAAAAVLAAVAAADAVRARSHSREPASPPSQT